MLFQRPLIQWLAGLRVHHQLANHRLRDAQTHQDLDVVALLGGRNEGFSPAATRLPRHCTVPFFLTRIIMCLPRQEKPAPERTARAASARTLRSKTSDLRACRPPGGGATRQALTFDAGNGVPAQHAPLNFCVSSGMVRVINAARWLRPPIPASYTPELGHGNGGFH